MILVQARFTKPDLEQMVMELRTEYETDAEMVRDGLKMLYKQRLNTAMTATV